MRYYLVENDHVTALPRAPNTLPEGSLVLKGIKDLDSRRFPMPRLLALLKAIPGAEPVKRFPHRKAAVERVWQALAALPMGIQGRESKQTKLIQLMKRPEGASIDELKTATGWQAHSVRGVISAILRKKLKLDVTRKTSGNIRVYRIAG